ncbi:hypothetical protein ABZ951_28155 [Streptomyces sp. NPDC046215]|uniref:Secreted protein n=1 Tax=Streptomyces stramineus TaxID=173861 RepID=A0ABN0ZUJ2_9ACTN
MQHRRPSAAAVLLLLLAVVFGPCLTGTASARAAGAAPAAASLTGPRAFETRAGETPAGAAEARPRADAGGADRGGTCKPQEAPPGGAAITVPHPQTDPLTGPGALRAALPAARVPAPAAPRAPPVPVAGCAELLPVLRI